MPELVESHLAEVCTSKCILKAGMEAPTTRLYKVNLQVALDNDGCWRGEAELPMQAETAVPYWTRILRRFLTVFKSMTLTRQYLVLEYR